MLSSSVTLSLPWLIWHCWKWPATCLPPLDNLTVAAGEASNRCRFPSHEDILALGVDRDVILVALGGGVIGDLVGFAAASLLRGVAFQVPTTLLAQVDSSVGGKTGVNAAAGKNLIGAFHQPRAVLADMASSIRIDRELRAGYAEVVKYGLLGDAAFFEWLEANGADVLARDDTALAHAVTTSCRPRHALSRRMNARRPAGASQSGAYRHALEAVCGYDGTLLHGEAVGTGMALVGDLATAIAVPVGTVGASMYLAGCGLVTRLADSPAAHAGNDRLIDIMRRDKKARRGKMRFVVPRAIGDSFVSDDVFEDMLHTVLDENMSGDILTLVLVILLLILASAFFQRDRPDRGIGCPHAPACRQGQQARHACRTASQ